MDDVKNSILIVDDEVMNITALTYMLSPEYTVYVESDGEGCIETARTLKPDLILLDVVMPGMTGFEVIEILKKSETTQDIPVIFITSLGDIQDEEMGLILGAADYIGKPFSRSIVALRVRNQLKILNQMRVINDLSITDSLTNIGNRRYFNSVLNQEWKRSARNQEKLSFMIMDIDNFKRFNDDYGHLEGDKVLVAVSEIIKNAPTRSTDKLARWGGEEFAVILPKTDLNGAVSVAEKIRGRVEDVKFILANGMEASITISIGVHTIIPKADGDDYTLDCFISDADNALYYAKRTGKNKVCTALESGNLRVTKDT